ncbi:MAG: hypothetical protein ACO1TE_16065 [Prosthecobacter sp.]
MDLGLDIFAGLIEGAVTLVAALVEVMALMIVSLLELFFLALEFVMYLALMCVPSSKSTGPPQRRKLTERTRIMVRRSLYAALALGAVGTLIYFVWIKEPPAPPPPKPLSPKVEKALQMIEKIKGIIPPKSPP